MALSHKPTYMHTSTLEDELAEATRDLLDLGLPVVQQHSEQQRNRFLSAALLDNRPLPTPSPFALNSSDVTRIDKALAIDPNARLTPIDDNGLASLPAANRPAPIVIQDSNAEVNTHDSVDVESSDSQYAIARSKTMSDEHLPASHLHRTVRSVTSSSGLLYEPTQSQKSRMNTASPHLLAAQEQLQSQSWLNARGERVLDSKIEQRMDMLQKRLAQAKVLSSATEAPSKAMPPSPTTEASSDSTTAAASHDRTPAFFRESFPDNKSSEDENDAPEQRPRIISASSSHTIHAPMPLHLSSVQPTAAPLVPADVMVKLHGNRRAEREAALLDEAGSDMHSDDAPVGDETLVSLDPSSSASPIDELDPHPTTSGGDTSSLLSLPATTGTSSSHASSSAAARRRSSGARRRRSLGNLSHRTSGSLEEDDAADATSSTGGPFTRDVTIRSFSVVGEKARGYVAYDVRITTRNGTTISILRRFSSFVALRKALLAECGPDTIRKERSTSSTTTTTSATVSATATRTVSLPPLPTRRTGLLHKYAAHHLEKRRRALQSWLATVMLNPTWGSSRALRQWVVGNDDEV